MTLEQTHLYHIIQTFVEINQEVFSNKDLNVQLKTLLRMVLGTIGIKRGAILAFQSRRLTPAVEVKCSFTDLPLLEPANFTFLSDKLWCTTAEIPSDHPLVPSIQGQQMQAILPLMINNALLGVVLLGDKVKKEPFTPFEVELLKTLAKNITVGIHNFNLLDQLRNLNQDLDNKVKEQITLGRIMEIINYEVGLTAIAREVLKELAPILHFKRALMFKIQSPNLLLLGEWGFPMDYHSKSLFVEGIDFAKLTTELSDSDELFRLVAAGIRLEPEERIFPALLWQNGEMAGLILLFLDKPLEPRNRSFLDHVLLQLAVAIKNNELYEQAITDVMTGLYVRRFFLSVLDKEIIRSRRTGRTMTLVMFDVDKFKVFNDTYGHDVGDQVLKMVALVLKSSIRTTDTPVRYGGEEFMLLLPETPIGGAFEVTERIRNKIQATTVNHQGQLLRVTASFGICEFPTNAETKEELILRADIALYHSKRNGRNQSTIYDPALGNEIKK